MGLLDLLGRKASDELEPAQVAGRQAAGALLIDVREDFEYQAGHAPGAKLVPLGKLSQQLPKLPKDREILFICQSGSRSSVATDLARRAGFPNAHNVRGGMTAWARARLPIKR
jgi:rhodanese-related sulfurtransferase